MLEADYEKYKGMAYGTAYRILKSHEDAEDAVQRAFVIVLRKEGQFRGECQWGTWFYRVVQRQALMILRSRRECRMDFHDDLENTAYERPHFKTPERLAMDAERFEIIRQRILQLSPKLQSAMYYAIGQAGGRGTKPRTNTEKSNLFRARQQLKSKLMKEKLREVMVAA